MECRDVRPLIDAFVSEQLLVETTQGIAAHLERCPACRAEVEGLRRLRRATRSAFDAAPDLAPSPQFMAALTSTLQAEAARPAASDWRLPRGWMALAASLLMVIVVGFGARSWSGSSFAALLHTAVGDHRFCALTFALDEPPIPLEEAARRYGGVYGALASVSPAASTLSGGPIEVLDRHSCVFQGRRFAHIVMRYKGEVVSMLVANDAGMGERLARLAHASNGETEMMPVTDGFHVASFRDGRHDIFVVSSLGNDDVQDVARALTQPVARALAGA